jgi:hypothetical protein
LTVENAHEARSRDDAAAYIFQCHNVGDTFATVILEMQAIATDAATASSCQAARILEKQKGQTTERPVMFTEVHASATSLYEQKKGVRWRYLAQDNDTVPGRGLRGGGQVVVVIADIALNRRRAIP